MSGKESIKRYALQNHECPHDDCIYYIKSGKKKRKILFKHNDFIVEVRCHACRQFSTVTFKEPEKVDIQPEDEILLKALDKLKAKRAK